MVQLEYKPLNETDAAQSLSQILAQCFISSPSDSRQYLDRLGPANFRTIYRNGQLAGGLALLSMGQWWLGRRVPMMGVAAVGIAPEHRGSGAALVLLQQMLRELYDANLPISVLYPATQRLYRKVGYEQGGTYNSWSIAAAEIQVRDRPLPMQPITAIEAKTFSDLHQQYAQRHNGHLDRHPAIWQELLNVDERETVHAYWIGADAPQGYVIFNQRRSNDQSILRVRDWAALSPAAGQSLWSFFADHRSQIETIRWRGAAIDPWLLWLPEQAAKLASSMTWMMRIVNAPLALVERGYPSGIETELHFQLHDDLIQENNGTFVLSVAQGTGVVSQGGRGDLKLGIQALAPLYTGLFTPSQLQLMGWLEASPTALATASLLFAGATPWLADFF
jgi:predicted acetyltransferase